MKQFSSAWLSGIARLWVGSSRHVLAGNGWLVSGFGTDQTWGVR